MRVFRVMVIATVLTVMMTGAASAQATGSIFGKVTDASGGVLPGVTVTVSGPTLQAPLVGVTQDSGAYQFPIVPIGTVSPDELRTRRFRMSLGCSRYLESACACTRKVRPNS